MPLDTTELAARLHTWALGDTCLQAAVADADAVLATR